MTDTLPWWEVAARAFEPRRERFATPGDLARHINPSTVQTPALDLVDNALIRAFNTPDSRLIISMAPQEGKSTRVSGDFPVWALTHNPDLRIVTASYGQSLATRNGRGIRRRIETTPDLGLTIAHDNGAAHEWELEGHTGGVFSVGVGGGVTGRAADMLIIDDPIKDRKQADSPTYRETVWDWWTDAASARLAPGAPVILILTRWHHDDLAGRLLDRDADAGWELLNIPAQAVDGPDADPLGREVGEYMMSARGRTTAQWEQRKRTAGSRTWASLYQGQPTPDEGNLFPAEGWARYTHPMWVDRDGARWVPEADRGDAELVQSWDFTFKDSDSSDYVVGQVWARRGATVHLLDMVRRRAGFSESVQMVRDLTARWPQARAKLIEDKANGPAIIDALRQHVPGIVPVNPGSASKYSRAAAITPYVEAGNVVLPDPVAVPGAGWVVDLTDEAAEFPAAAHDDTVDAMSQAVDHLLSVKVLDPNVHTLDNDHYDLDPLTQWEADPYTW